MEGRRTNLNTCTCRQGHEPNTRVRSYNYWEFLNNTFITLNSIRSQMFKIILITTFYGQNFLIFLKFNC